MMTSLFLNLFAYTMFSSRVWNWSERFDLSWNPRRKGKIVFVAWI